MRTGMRFRRGTRGAGAPRTGAVLELRQRRRCAGVRGARRAATRSLPPTRCHDCIPSAGEAVRPWCGGSRCSASAAARAVRARSTSSGVSAHGSTEVNLDAGAGPGGDLSFLLGPASHEQHYSTELQGDAFVWFFQHDVWVLMVSPGTSLRVQGFMAQPIA